MSSFDHALGTMTPDEARTADDHLLVEFHVVAVKDELLTDGGLISVRHPRLPELQKMGIEMRPYIKAFPTEDDHFVVEPAGRLICRDVEFIRIITPGDRNKIINRPIEPQDKVRFSRRYEAWKTGRTTAGMIGTPIAEVPFISASTREELAYFNVHTAEQLVELPEAVAMKFMGIHQLQGRVRHWLEGASSAALTEKLNAEKHAQEVELQATRDALKALQAQMAELQANLKK